MNAEQPTGIFRDLKPGDVYRTPWTFAVMRVVDAEDAQGNTYLIPWFRQVIQDGYTMEAAQCQQIA